MTRETKVGIVVSCSFLSLVGVVVASKLRAGPPPSQEGATEAVAQVKPKAAPTATRKPDKEAPLPASPPGAAPTTTRATEQSPPSAKALTPAGSTPPGVIPASFAYANTTAPTKEDKSNEGAGLTPPADDKTTTWLGVPLPQQADPKEGTTVASAGPPSGTGENATPPPAAAAEGGVTPALPPTAPAPPSAPAPPADIAPPPSGIDTANTDKTDSDKKAKEGDAKKGADGGEKGENGKGDKDKKVAADEVMPAPPGAVAVPPGSAPASAPEKASTEKPEVPVDSGKAGAVPTTRLGAPDKLPGGGTENEGANKPKKEGDKPPGEKNEAVPSAPAIPALPEGVAPPPGTPAPAEEKKGTGGPPPQTEEKAPAATVPPMVAPPTGADLDKVKPPAAEKAEEKSRPVSPAPAATIAPVVARTAEGPRPTVGATRPVVESFSEEEYTVKPGDTYATISQAKYYSQNYAEALRLYNRNDSLLSDGADGTGGLKPGQKVSVPDLRILEKRYSHVLPKVPTEGTSRKTSADVQPVNDTRAPQEKAPSYTVRSGETMRSIAKRSLGNGDRWEEIYRLNRSYNPEVELPVGAVLRLPPLGERGVSTP